MLVDLRGGSVRSACAALRHHRKLALVTAHGSRAIAVEVDPSLQDVSLRQGRLRPELLKRLCWHYLRVPIFDLFSDPDSAAERVALGAREPSPLTTTLPVIVVAT